jgi:hypothetical protein
MSTSASSKSTGTRKNLASGLTRLSNEAIPVLRLAKESVAGIGIPGPEAALGGVLAVAEMIQVRDFVLYMASFIIRHLCTRICNPTRTI